MNKNVSCSYRLLWNCMESLFANLKLMELNWKNGFHQQTLHVASYLEPSWGKDHQQDDVDVERPSVHLITCFTVTNLIKAHIHLPPMHGNLVRHADWLVLTWDSRLVDADVSPRYPFQSFSLHPPLKMILLQEFWKKIGLRQFEYKHSGFYSTLHFNSTKAEVISMFQLLESGVCNILSTSILILDS